MWPSQGQDAGPIPVSRSEKIQFLTGFFYIDKNENIVYAVTRSVTWRRFMQKRETRFDVRVRIFVQRRILNDKRYYWGSVILSSSFGGERTLFFQVGDDLVVTDKEERGKVFLQVPTNLLKRKVVASSFRLEQRDFFNLITSACRDLDAVLELVGGINEKRMVKFPSIELGQIQTLHFDSNDFIMTYIFE